MIPRTDDRTNHCSISRTIGLSAICALLFLLSSLTELFARAAADSSGRPGTRAAAYVSRHSVGGEPASAVAANPETRPSDRVPVGSWGGRHVEMEVTEEGARLEFDCASASIQGAIPVDKRGALEVRGFYFQERPGPQREGEEAKGRPARFTGKLSGKELTIIMTLEDNQEEIGSYTLLLGQAGILRKCR